MNGPLAIASSSAVRVDVGEARCFGDKDGDTKLISHRLSPLVRALQPLTTTAA